MENLASVTAQLTVAALQRFNAAALVAGVCLVLGTRESRHFRCRRGHASQVEHRRSVQHCTP